MKIATIVPQIRHGITSLVGRRAARRSQLLANLARLDQLTTEAEEILAGPADVEIGCMAEALREMLIDMRAKVEEKLDR